MHLLYQVKQMRIVQEDVSYKRIFSNCTKGNELSYQAAVQECIRLEHQVDYLIEKIEQRLKENLYVTNNN